MRLNMEVSAQRTCQAMAHCPDSQALEICYNQGMAATDVVGHTLGEDVAKLLTSTDDHIPALHLLVLLQ